MKLELDAYVIGVDMAYVAEDMGRACVRLSVRSSTNPRIGTEKAKIPIDPNTVGFWRQAFADQKPFKLTIETP